MFNKMFNKSKNIEAEYAAGMNFDLDEVVPFLQRLSSSILDTGFSEDDINNIQSEINAMEEDNEEKEIGSFDVIYKGKPRKIRIYVEIHIEDVDKEVVLYMYSIQELVDRIDEEMLKIEDEREY